jgi:hypothetical protein
MQGLSFIAALSTAAYRARSLHPPGYSVTAAVLRTVIKDTPRVNKIIALYITSRLINY